MGLKKPTPIPAKTPTLGCGCGFVRVRVWVALENPRVAHDNPYLLGGMIPQPAGRSRIMFFEPYVL